MRRAFLFLLAFTFCTLLTGCTSYTKVSSDQLNDFTKTIKSQFKPIKGLKVQFAPTRFQFRYSLKEKMNETDIAAVFAQTKELILSKRLQEEMIEGTYFKKYSKQDRIYPRMSISFDTDQDGEAEFKFSSDYYKGSEGANIKKEIDGYHTWFYTDDYKKMPQPVSS